MWHVLRCTEYPEFTFLFNLVLLLFQIPANTLLYLATNLMDNLDHTHIWSSVVKFACA